MSENKFIAKLKGEPTPKSVVEIQNDRLVAPFKSSPMGHIADRDSSVVAAKGAQNWAVNQGQLVPVADDYVGTESNLTATSRVSGAGLWLNATYTFPMPADEKNPVSAIIAPSAKWVLTLCGDSLMTQNGSVITLTMLIKIGGTHLTTKQFKIRECASQFSHRLAIDFSESEQKVIKAYGTSQLTVQILCDDEGASATIYSGMTHLTLLQRKIDADLVSTDNILLPEFIENLLEGYIIPEDFFNRYEYLEQVREDEDAIPRFTRNGDEMTFTGWSKGVLYKAGENITISEDNVISSTTQESFFRGRYKNWDSVPTNGLSYPNDINGNHIPSNTDYIIIEDSSTVPGGQVDVQMTMETDRYSSYPTIKLETVVNGTTYNGVGVFDDGNIEVFCNTDAGNYTAHWKTLKNNVEYQGVTYEAGSVFFKVVIRPDKNTTQNAKLSLGNPYTGSWRFSYRGTWDLDNRNGWKAEYQIEEVLPTADETQAGIAKLYTTSGSNTDGAMTQKAITENTTRVIIRRWE